MQWPTTNLKLVFMMYCSVSASVVHCRIRIFHFLRFSVNLSILCLENLSFICTLIFVKYTNWISRSSNFLGWNFKNKLCITVFISWTVRKRQMSSSVRCFFFCITIRFWLQQKHWRVCFQSFLVHVIWVQISYIPE